MAAITLLRPEARCNASASAPFNLLRERWLPIRRRDGSRDLISPAQIVDPSIVAVDWPRPDFRIATLEFLIGLLATACPPADEDEWCDGWENPPRLDFAPLEFAFNLDGDGPRFMQDLDPNIEGRTWPMQDLLLDSLADNAAKKGRTVFQKPIAAQRFSRAAAAIALYALQTYAPQGGSGNRVSLRGGAPLTLMVQPGGEPSLWRTLWANVPYGKRPTADDLPRICPWLAPTRSNLVTTPADAHPLQAFWGMPRRVRLTFGGGGVCDLLTTPDDALVVEWRQQGGGPEYAAWTHPLAAYRQAAPNKPRTAVRGSSNVGYSDWAGWVFGNGSHQFPAQTLVNWRTRVVDLPDDVRQHGRILAAGFVSSEGAVSDRFESEMPLPGSVASPAAAHVARQLVEAASLVCGAVVYASQKAARVKSPNAPTAAIWRDTAPDFHRLLRDVRPGLSGEEALEAAAADWLTCLNRVATDHFRAAFPLVPGDQNALDIAKQWQWLRDTFRGLTSTGKKILSALNMSLDRQ